MAIIFDAPVTPDALTTFVREVPAPPGLGLLNQFPTRFVNDNRFDFAEVLRTNRTARFRTFDGRIHVSERDGGTDKWVPLPPLSSSLNMGEYERLQLEFARTGGTRDQALAAAVYNDATILTREVLNRLELAWGDILTDGKLTMLSAAGEPQLESDFAVPPENIVTAATPWTTVATAPALTNLRTWSDVWKLGGGVDGVIRTSQRVIRLFQANKEVIDAVYGSTQGRTRVNLTELNDLLSADGLPTLVPAYDGQVDVDGTATRVIADDKLIITPRDLGDLGSTVFGISATALELVNSNLAELTFEEAAGIVGVVIKLGPPFRQFTFVDAVGMPILEAPRQLFVADVI